MEEKTSKNSEKNKKNRQRKKESKSRWKLPPIVLPSRPEFSIAFFRALLTDPKYLWIVSIGILAVELVLNIFVVHRVNYTEIDWKAYMQECEGFLNGTFDYSKLRGDTGPLVYPAGFVYVYSILYFITSRGTNIRLAQYIFIGIYLLTMGLVLRLYTKSRKVPPYVLIICAFTSYRIHSIYVLRLFNDPIAMLFLYFALNLFLDRDWDFGSLFFSLAVSVKMNILLFAPALLLLYWTNLGLKGTLKQLSICAGFQLLVGAPFLLTYPIEYLRGSFDVGRVFEHKWTVNYRFLDVTTFESRAFHLSLLVVHLFVLMALVKPATRYFRSFAVLKEQQEDFQRQIDAENERRANAAAGAKKSNDSDETQGLTTSTISVNFDQMSQVVLLPMFFCNFIGIVFARSLHYQFYVWYFHSLPYLMWSTPLPTNVRFLILFVIEYCWNTYPSTVLSSCLLHVCHLAILYQLMAKFLSIFRVKTEEHKCAN